MDSTLNEFLNEIDEIAPLKTTRNECDWKQCFDEKTGFSYYWNVKTDEVTWEKPANFIPSPSVSQKHRLNFVPKSPEILNKVKIYNIATNCNEAITVNTPGEQHGTRKSATNIEIEKKTQRNDSDDEKITLITSYGSESESEDEISKNDEGDVDILSTVRKKAEELKKIGEERENTVSGISLLAGYESNSGDETSDDEDPVKIPELPAGHSTLFPIVEPVKIEDFTETHSPNVENDENLQENSESFDAKNFQRKRRLGVTFVPSFPVPDRKETLYSNFKSGGVEFAEKPDDGKDENHDEIVENYEILHEKLAFLCEGNKEIQPVQIIKIQIETLFGALRSKCLKAEYLAKWLEGTCEDLVKLEKEAAPAGWLLKWDRTMKRYCYHNNETGDCQWEYPDEVEQNGEAMDISTTPPHSPPPKSPSPPPPPTITTKETPENKEPLPPGVEPETKVDAAAFSSFYSEIAAIEEASSCEAPDEHAPKKKKKKMRLGQSLRNKEVSKLVEKWKSVQNNY